MATIRDTAATSALNEEQYINKLYDTNRDNQNKVLQENFSNDNALLNQQEQQTQKQTDAYVNRTGVESQKAANQYGTGGVSAGAQAQVDLTQENARRRNVNALQGAQNDAQAEYQRIRQLRAKQFEADIKQAQAENDMGRAQALYEAAKAEDAQLLQLYKQGALLMQGKGDGSMMDALASGGGPVRDTGSGTWDEVLKNEDPLNKIYDAQLESMLTQINMDYERSASDLEAKRAQQEQQTDEKLTDAYVAALKGQKNQGEMSQAYGRGSGAVAQGRLASDVDLQDTLTDIRRQQVEKDAQSGLEAAQLGENRGKKSFEAQRDVDEKRVQALIDAAENEEQILVGNQQFVGNQMAAAGDYEMLGKLYGLTPDQIDRLMGRGAYAPVGGWEPPARRYRKPEDGDDEVRVSSGSGRGIVNLTKNVNMVK